MITMFVDLVKICVVCACKTNNVLIFIHLHAMYPLTMHFVLIV